MAKFTRRHYEAVAEVFWIRRQELETVDRMVDSRQAHADEWSTLQKRFRRLFLADSSAFKPDLFDRACGREG